MKKPTTVTRLTDELFEAVQAAQGYAFHSDDVSPDMAPEAFFERVRGRLEWTYISAAIIRKFLKKYGQLKFKQRTRPRKRK